MTIRILATLSVVLGASIAVAHLRRGERAARSGQSLDLECRGRQARPDVHGGGQGRGRRPRLSRVGSGLESRQQAGAAAVAMVPAGGPLRSEHLTEVRIRGVASGGWSTRCTDTGVGSPGWPSVPTASGWPRPGAIKWCGCGARAPGRKSSPFPSTRRESTPLPLAGMADGSPHAAGTAKSPGRSECGPARRTNSVMFRFYFTTKERSPWQRHS